MSTRLPWTAKDVFRLSPTNWLIYNGVIACCRITGCWRHPIEASGDFETMRRLDKIYWLYKAQFPIARATKGSGLEAFFQEHAATRWSLPGGFEPLAALQLSAVGDLMDHPYLANSAGCLYEDVADAIFGVDIAMANLECVIHPQASGPFVIRSTATPPLCFELDHFHAVEGFRDRRYSFMATANNHSLDCGGPGVESTIRTLRAGGIAFHGTNQSLADAQSATIIESRGFKVGLISQTFGLNGKRVPPEMPWIVNRMHLNGKPADVDFGAFAMQLESCRQNAVDLVIAQLHWGMEHEYYPRPEQLEVAHHLAEMGVDIVIGHHPHLVQPIECYRTRRDPDRVVPIFYSLGNLVTPFSHPAFRRAVAARIRVTKGVCRDGLTRTYVDDVDTIETFQEIDEHHRKLRLVALPTAA